MLKRNKMWVRLGLVFVGCAVWMTLTPSPPTAPGIKLSDKAMHLLGYCALMGWWGNVHADLKPRLRWAGVLVVMGVVLEFLQGWGGVRQFEVADMIANSLGVVSGLALVHTPLGRVLLAVEGRLA